MYTHVRSSTIHNIQKGGNNLNTPQNDVHIQCTLYENSKTLFGEMEKLNLKFIWNCKQTEKTKQYWKKKNRTHTSWIQNLTESYSNQNSVILRKRNRSMDKIESPDINPHQYVQQIFDNGTNTIQWRRNSLCKNGTEICESHMQKIEVGLLPHSIHKY